MAHYKSSVTNYYSQVALLVEAECDIILCSSDMNHHLPQTLYVIMLLVELCVVIIQAVSLSVSAHVSPVSIHIKIIVGNALINKPNNINNDCMTDSILSIIYCTLLHSNVY